MSKTFTLHTSHTATKYSTAFRLRHTQNGKMENGQQGPQPTTCNIQRPAVLFIWFSIFSSHENKGRGCGMCDMRGKRCDGSSSSVHFATLQSTTYCYTVVQMHRCDWNKSIPWDSSLNHNCKWQVRSIWLNRLMTLRGKSSLGGCRGKQQRNLCDFTSKNLERFVTSRSWSTSAPVSPGFARSIISAIATQTVARSLNSFIFHLSYKQRIWLHHHERPSRLVFSFEITSP